VTSKQIYSEGVGYKALIISGLSTTTVASMDKIETFAKQGLPIIFIGDGPSDVSGTPTDENIAIKVLDVYERLRTKYANVLTLGAEDNLLHSLIDRLDVKGYATYSIPNLETLMCLDKTDGTNYYYLFNNTTTNFMMPMSYSFRQYKQRISRISGLSWREWEPPTCWMR